MGIELVERLRRLAKVFGGKCAEDCTEAADRIEELERDLFNLVCRIHRDGGHYIAKHGEAKAIADADTVAAQNNAYLDALQADNARLRDALEDSYMTNPCDTNSQQKAFDKAQSALATTGDKHGS